MEGASRGAANAAAGTAPAAAKAKMTKVQSLALARDAKRRRQDELEKASRQSAQSTTPECPGSDSGSYASRFLRTGSSRSSGVERYSPIAQRSATGNRLDVPPPPEELAAGSRIIDLPQLYSNLLPHLTCPGCSRTGKLCVRLNDERSRGLGGDLKFFCERCKDCTLTLPTSNILPLKETPIGVVEQNLRLVVGAIVAGMGQNSSARFCGVLGVPSLDDKAFDRAAARVIPAFEAAGDASCRRWLDEERMQAICAGETLRADGRVGIPISYDAQWLKPGKTFNAPDGYGSAVGGRTGKCVRTAYRTKVGTLQNHTGSSGSMEPAMGAEVVVNLGMEH